MPTGGQLTISARHVDRAPSLNGASSLRGPHVALSVQDTGLGIAQDVVAHIFEPFFSTKAKHENSGLGLSQVQGFVRQSGGDVEVQSALGQGTTFTLYLPAAETPNEVTAAAGGDSTAEISARNDILLVEDNRMVGEVVSTLLTGLGQNLTWAVDAENAFRMLQEKDGRFDIAILDVVLPGMNGVELAHKIRAQWPNIRIVLATGYSEALAGKDAFAFQVMQKPYSVEALARLLVED
ncbi:Blue-light-activated protein [compost metagenome]